MDTFHDLETFSAAPIKEGAQRYARHKSTEIMLWAFAVEDGPIMVWDRVNGELWAEDDLAGSIEFLREVDTVPDELLAVLANQDALVFFHNGGNFDYPVIDNAAPHLGKMIPMARRRDTMIQAYAHSMPGALDKLGEVLGLHEDEQKYKRGKALIHRFCMPQRDGSRCTRETHPEEWVEFIRYAGRDIKTMRVAHAKLPMWNYRGKQVELWHTDLAINNRGFCVDLELAAAALRASDQAKGELAAETQQVTNGAVQSTTQRDATLAYILAEHGVDLPDLRADTLERRLDDANLPDGVKVLLLNRLQASMNSVAKFKVFLRSTCDDGRMRGTHQFRGAGRTGRWAHRQVQPGNWPRPTMSAKMIQIAIDSLKADCADLIFTNVQEACSNAIRGTLVASPGKKLVVADLANIEGRFAAWIAGEEWKLQAFRDYDAGTGPDLYVMAYANAFNVDPQVVIDDKEHGTGLMRQIGKVMELMLQYEGGVGAFVTGAATYGIDLVALAETAWPTLPEWAKDEAQRFLDWLYEVAEARHKKAVEKAQKTLTGIAYEEAVEDARARLAADKAKARHGLSEKVFMTCDALKRMWRRAHPAISSIWRELKETVCMAITDPGVTFTVRERLKIRRDGAWLRIGLPSGRALCYPNPKVEDDGTITFTGQDTYTRKWGRTKTYGGKLFENIVQAGANDQFAEPLPTIERAGYACLVLVHDEVISETPDTDEYSAEKLGALMCMDLGWNKGLPLAAAGFEDYRYRKG